MSSPFEQIYRKRDYDFVAYNDARFQYSGHWQERPDQTLNLGFGRGSSIQWNGPGRDVLFLVMRHPWSGTISVDKDPCRTENLYSICTYTDAILANSLTIVGKPVMSQGEELIIYGAFVPRTSLNDSQSEMSSFDEEGFRSVQTDQVDRWIRNIIETGQNIEEITLKRRDAYLMRWRETEPYVNQGAKVLDIGCGNFLPGMLEYFAQANFNYTGLDIDERVIDGNIAKTQGRPNFSFLRASNEKLPCLDDEFDFVFSSHSLEHSSDLESSFNEIMRVLKPGGWLFFAVPLDVDNAPEHLWIISPEIWKRLPSVAGFSLRNIHIGDIYPEIGYDMVVVAQKPK